MYVRTPSLCFCWKKSEIGGPENQSYQVSELVESFLSSLKKGRVERTYKIRNLIRTYSFDYTVILYNQSRHHSHIGCINPKAFEKHSSRGRVCLRA